MVAMSPCFRPALLAIRLPTSAGSSVLSPARNSEAVMSSEIQRASTIDRLIHEPSRMLIMAILYAGEQVSFLYLLGETNLTRGNLSTHLTRLEQGGYIQIEVVRAEAKDVHCPKNLPIHG
jgi:hypothetical protein